MPGVDYDAETAAPTRRSTWVALAVVAAVVLLVWARGVVTLLVAALVLVVIGVVVGSVIGLTRSVKEHTA
jgi:hypothetical protein